MNPDANKDGEQPCPEAASDLAIDIQAGNYAGALSCWFHELTISQAIERIESHCRHFAARENEAQWMVGIPRVPKGKQESFWCRVKNTGSEIEGLRLIKYDNAFLMPLSDTCDEAPENSLPVGDDENYEWTGWWEDSCEQCDTYWAFNGEVVAWIRLPSAPAKGPTP